MTDLTPDTLLKRGSEHVETNVADQTMMMSVTQGKYYALEGTARRIWDHLGEPTTLEKLVDKLVTEYNITPDRCLDEVKVFIAELMDNGLVVRADGKAQP